MKQPDAPRSADSVTKARYIFEQYCDALAGKGVNSELIQRYTWLFERGRNFLACTEHLNNMQDIFEGAGIKGADFIVADKLKNIVGCIRDVNCNHVAVLIKNEDGQIFVFDPWMHAVSKLENEEPYSSFNVVDADKAVDQIFTDKSYTKFYRNVYGGGKNSPFNGMKWEDWVTYCQKRGYIEFRLNGYSGAAGRDLASIGALFKDLQKTNRKNDCILCGGTKDCYFALNPFRKGEEPWIKPGSYEPYAHVYSEDGKVLVEFYSYPYVDPCGDPTKIQYLHIEPSVIFDAKHFYDMKRAPLGWQPEGRCNGVRLDQLLSLRSKKYTGTDGREYSDLCNEKPITNSVIWDTWFTYATPTAS